MRARLILLLLAAPVFAQEDPFLHELRAGHQFLKALEFDKAVQQFARARAIDPANWRGYMWECATLILKGRQEPNPHRRLQILQEAEAMTSELHRRAKVWFTDPLSLYLRGEIKIYQGRDVQAYRLLKEGTQAKPHRLAPYAEIQLRERLKFSFALAALHVAIRLVGNGRFEDADRVMAESEDGLRDTEFEPRYLRQYAVVCENLRRYDEAIASLRRVGELSDNEETKQEMAATIAMIHFQQNRLEQGLEVLAEVPADSTHPEVVAARCMHQYKLAIGDPTSEKMDAALAHYRKVIATRPMTIAYRLAEDFTEMVLAKVGPREAESERALLQEAVRIAVREQERRPECASLYFALYRLHKLLGDARLEIHYQQLYELKKKEAESQPKYAASGRPFCR